MIHFFAKVTVVAAIAFLSLSQIACEKKEKLQRPQPSPKIEIRTDGLTYEIGQAAPYTGVIRKYIGKSHALRKEFNYLNGQKNGYESHWYDENPKQLKEQSLWVRGEPMFQWKWWPNGNMREISAQRDGQKNFQRPDIAYGSYVKWFADGKLQFKAHYDENFLWHGHVIDYNDAGKMMWDAQFDRGIYVSGYRAPETLAPATPEK